MASELLSVSIVAPGFAGLNTQDSSIALTKDYALRADNAVIDQFGRIAARQGWVKVNTTSGFAGTEPTLIHEVIKIDGTTQLVSIGDKKIFTGTTTLTQVYADATWTASNWKAVNFNGHTYFFQRAHDPLVYDHALNTWTKVSAHPNYSGTVPLGNEVLAAYGRLWVADTTTDKTTVTWSDTLSGAKWSGGAAGSVNIENILTNGTDSIVALAAFNGYLIIFCKTTIVIYSGADVDPAADLKLVEVIDGVGCIARDSVQDVGTDMFFLSDSGVKSLARVIQEKSNPIIDISRNVRDDLILAIAGNNDNSLIKAVYSQKQGFYLLSFPSLGLLYCFDLKTRLQDGVCKATLWTLTPKAFCSSVSRSLYFSRPGYIAEYSGYSDNESSYRFVYYSSYLDAGSASLLKILKKITLSVIGAGGTPVFLKWGVEYTQNYQSTLLPELSLSARSEYNVAQYNISEYNSSNTSTNFIRSNIGGSGKVFQIGIEADILNDLLSVQQMDIYFKTGRTA